MSPNGILMVGIKRQWGGLIAASISATKIPASFLGALIANESNGNQWTKRFEQAIYSELLAKYSTWPLPRLVDNATSWGLTQILGDNYPGEPFLLLDPKVGLPFTVILLEQFATRWDLDLSKDFEQLFRCWNTGKSDGTPFDPQYIPNGLLRMSLYDNPQ